MKHLLLCLLGVAAAGAPGELVQHRGVWLHPKQFETPALADEWIAKATAARLNALYPLVWYDGGTAWFRSRACPMAKGVPEGHDPLGYLAKAARARGMDVHPWFVNGSCGHARPGPLLAQHPDWVVQTGGAMRTPWYDLGKPAVRDFQRDLMLECLRDYDVDGLHFDYIRYADQSVCYCEICQGEFARRTGHPARKPGEERLPALLEISANPLDGPTTAKVLATFDHGVPAIASNRPGSGEVILVNWSAMSRPCPVLDGFLKETLGRFGANAANTFQLSTTATAGRYGRETQDQAQAWLRQLGFPAKIIDEKALDRVPKGGTIVLAGQYLMEEETAKRLEEFARGGGRCLFLDGPVFAVKFEPMKRLTGMRTTARYFHGWKVVSPAPDQDLLKPGPPLDVERERRRMEQWVAYRKDTVTELVRAVQAGARKVKPRAWVSAAVFYTKEAAERVCQDWTGWLREGYLDYALPMAYTEKNDDLAGAFAEWRALDPELERIIPGLSIYSKRQGQSVPRDLDLIRSQLEMARAQGARGNLFFSLSYLTDDLVRFLSTGPFAEPARPYYPPRR